MTPSQHFCGQCGSPIKEAVRFCTTCGTPVAQGISAQPAPGVMTGERVLAAIAGIRKEAFLKSNTQYALLLTPTRVIVAVITDQMVKDQVERAVQEAKTKGSGFFGQVFAKVGASLDWMASLRNVAKVFLTMDPNAVLGLNPENFAFPRQDLTFVSLTRQDTQRTVTDHSGSHHHHHVQHSYHYHVILTTRNGAYVYDAPYDMMFREEMLAAFPGMVQETG